MNLKELLEIAQNQLDVIKKDAEKFEEKSNNSAGTRVRTGSMALIKILKNIRTKVQEIKSK